TCIEVKYFFFSSRRRHTRSKRDWSSDVCSSDLGKLPVRLSPALAGSPDPAAPALEQVLSAMFAADPRARPSAAGARDALPEPTGGPGQWALTADGERFEVFDQIEPLEAGSPGHGAPEVPLDGP